LVRRGLKFSLISRAIEKNPHLSIRGLCTVAGVSTSGYYSWVKRPYPAQTREEKLIIQIFNRKHRKAGYRTILMELERRYGMCLNHKKVRRIMEENRLHTIIRRKRKYISYSELSKKSKPFENLVARNFSPERPDQIDSGDITEFQYRNGKAYLYAVKDLCTKEIVSHAVTGQPGAEIVATTYENRIRKIPPETRKHLISHSDQGGQFFSDIYRKTLEKHGVRQSMSAKGVCLDNAPIESFFGHFKDEVDVKNCESLKDVKRVVDGYIKYYNTKRPQWGLNRKTPAECRG
jgi:putative transposase